MKNKTFFGLIFAVVLLFLVALMYGCATSPTSPPSPTLSTRLYFASLENSVGVLNLETLTTEESIVFPDATADISGVALSADKKILYATDRVNNKILSYNTETSAFDSADSPYQVDYIFASHDGSKIFASMNVYAGFLSFTTSPFTFEAFVTSEVGGSTYSYAISPDDNYVYAPNYDNNFMMKYDVSGQSIIGTTEGHPSGIRPSVLAFHPNGQKIYFTDDTADKVFILDTATFSVEGTSISVGHGPWGIDFILGGSKAYVANYNDNTVSVIQGDIEVSVITDEANTGPAWIIADSSRNRAYMSGWTEPIISVIDTTTDTIVATIEYPAFGASDQIILGGGSVPPPPRIAF